MNPIEAAVRDAGEQALAIWRRGAREQRDKGGAERSSVDIVTEGDLLVDRLIREALQRHEPGVKLVSEEGATDPAEDCFVLDPIDGTHNFAAGLPAFAVSLARVRAGRPEEAWLLELPAGRLFHADRTRPTTVDGVPVRVTEREPRWTVISVGLSLKVLPLLANAHRWSGVRTFGSHALGLAWSCEGRVGLHAGRGFPWDVAAGYLLVEQAGGVVSRFDGSARPLWDHEYGVAGAPHQVELALELFARGAPPLG